MPDKVRQYLHDLENENRILKEENQQFRKVLPRFEKKLKDLEKENQELKDKIIKLENRLRMYENPHTPSSKQRFKKNSSRSSSNKRHGAPKGHRGATRKIPKPDEIISVPTDHCPNCGCNPGESKSIETVTTEELPPPQKIKVTQYELYTYKCPNCGLKFTTKHNDCPQKGGFGVNLLTQITTLKYHLRGVLRKIQDFLKYVYDFDISPTGIHDALLRVGDACKRTNTKKFNNGCRRQTGYMRMKLASGSMVKIGGFGYSGQIMMMF